MVNLSPSTQLRLELFCSSLGSTKYLSDLIAKSNAFHKATGRCSVCGFKFKPNANFCTSCGWKETI